MLSADADLQARPDGPALCNRDLHQLAHAHSVKRFKRVLRIDLHLDVRDQEPRRVVAAHPQRRLRQIVRPEAEEFGDAGDFIRRERAPRNLDHRADEIFEFRPFLLHDLSRHLADDFLLVRELLDVPDERDHDLGLDGDAARLDIGRRFEDRPRLHLGDLGEDDPQAASAEPEHRVELVESFDTLVDLFVRDPHLPSQLALRRLLVGDELVKRRIDRADRDGAAVHCRKDPLEVLPLEREKLRKRFLALLDGVGEDHLTHRSDLPFAEEHVLRTAEADPLGAEGDRV